MYREATTKEVSSDDGGRRVMLSVIGSLPAA
jgi:hypothetical protein